MRLKVKIESNRPIILPRSYNHILQAWLYKQISDPAYRLFLHNEGYRYKNRAFRLFTFSRLQGSWKADKEQNHIIFNSPVYIQIASPLMPFMQEVAMSVLMGEESYWDRNIINVTSVEVINDDLPIEDQQLFQFQTKFEIREGDGMLAESIIRVRRPIKHSSMSARERIRLLTDVSSENCKNYFRHVFLIEINGEDLFIRLLQLGELITQDKEDFKVDQRRNTAFPIFYS